MGNLLSKLVKAAAIITIMLAFVDSNAQKRYAPLAVGDCQYTIENDVQISPTEMQFDLYVKDTDASDDFQLSVIQAGVLVNTSILASGATYAAAHVAGFSEINPVMLGNILVAVSTGGRWQIKLTAKAAPGCGAGTIISKTGLGTRIDRISITSNLPFVASSQASLVLTINTGANPYPTKVFEYISCISTEVVAAKPTGSTYQNIYLNPPAAPTAFNVTGGGSYLFGNPGLPVGLDGSQIGVTYTLYQDAVAQVPTVAGTGGIISFGDQPGTHTYTVKGANGGPAVDMLGNAVITLTYAMPTWLGTLTTDWKTAGNWSDNTLPLSGDNVLIPSGRPHFPVISTFNDVACNNMTVNSGANVTINANASLTLTGSLSLGGAQGLIIKSDATGSGSFIDNGVTGGGTAKVERYLSGWSTLTDQKYHFLSSPVAGQAIQGAGNFVVLPNTTDDFYKFDETIATWINTKADNGTWNTNFEPNFVVGRGYLTMYQNTTTKNFIGTLNTNDIASSPLELTCTNTIAPPGADGWNLIGNPYASAIDWDIITKTNIDNALYYYSADNSNYKYYLPLGSGEGYLGGGSRYIPAMQGFMIHASVNNGTITLDNSMRTHLGMDTYNKSTSTELSNYLVLTVDGNNFSDEAYIYFTNEATQNFDANFDARKLTSMNPGVPMMYTKTPDDHSLAINSLPPSAASTPLPLSFKAGADGSYTITASQLNTFQNDASITLEDLKTGTTQNLMQNPVYAFNGLTTDVTGRFLLHFAGTIGIADNKDTNPVNIYSVDKTVYISCASGLRNGQLMITDLLGKQLLSKKLNDQVLNQVRLNVSEGYYIVKVQTDNTVKAVKVYLK